LNLNVPKPSFATSHTRTAFGFQAMAIPDTDRPQDITMADSDGVDDANKTDEGADGSTSLSISFFTYYKSKFSPDGPDLIVDELSPGEEERMAVQYLKADPPHDTEDHQADSGFH
jgi:hypothetical protein